MRNFALFCKWIDRWDNLSSPELFDSYKRYWTQHYQQNDSVFTENELEIELRERLGEYQ